MKYNGVLPPQVFFLQTKGKSKTKKMRSQTYIEEFVLSITETPGYAIIVTNNSNKTIGISQNNFHYTRGCSGSFDL